MSNATDQDLVQILRDAGVEVDDLVASVTPDEPSRNDADTLVEQRGLTPVRGRVYLPTNAIEAAARVANTGTPEVVEVEGGRTSHLVLWLTDKGTVAAQNYIVKG